MKALMQTILLIGKTKIPKAAIRRKLDSSIQLKVYRMNRRSKIPFSLLVQIIEDKHVTKRIISPPCIQAFSNQVKTSRKIILKQVN